MTCHKSPREIARLPRPPKGNSTSIRLEHDLHLRVRRIAADHGLTTAVIVRAALHSALSTWERDGMGRTLPD